MKTTLELPDELMRDVKIRAAQSGKEAEGDALHSAVAATASALVVPLDAVQALAHRLIFLLDGTVSNPNLKFLRPAGEFPLWFKHLA